MPVTFEVTKPPSHHQHRGLRPWGLGSFFSGVIAFSLAILDRSNWVGSTHFDSKRSHSLPQSAILQFQKEPLHTARYVQLAKTRMVLCSWTDHMFLDVFGANNLWTLQHLFGFLPVTFSCCISHFHLEITRIRSFAVKVWTSREWRITMHYLWSYDGGYVVSWFSWHLTVMRKDVPPAELHRDQTCSRNGQNRMFRTSTMKYLISCLLFHWLP
jgi:hypothetical protein